MVNENRHLINCLRDDYDHTVLMRAVFSNNDDAFDYLIKKSQDFSVVDRDGLNIIHYIVMFGDDEKCESQLIKLSQETNVESLINKRDVDGDTPLHVCLLYTSPSPRDGLLSRMPSSA